MDTLTLWRSRNRDGDTYALAPATSKALDRDHGTDKTRSPRVFLGHYELPPRDLNLLQQEALVNLLTHLPKEITRTYQCEVWDPGTDTLLETWWTKATP